MTFAEYQSFILSLAKNMKIVDVPGKLQLGALGLTGEAGEFADLVKKHLYHEHIFDTNKMARELGDVLWYVAYAADAIGFSLEQIAEMNKAKLIERYPNGFDAQRSINRGDK